MSLHRLRILRSAEQPATRNQFRAASRADPLFKDAAGGDFTVTSAEALQLGIVPLDLKDAGPDWNPDDHRPAN